MRATLYLAQLHPFSNRQFQVTKTKEHRES